MDFPEDLRVNATFPFPSLVQGSGPVTVAKANGVWTVGYDISRFPIRSPQPNDYILVWDSMLNVFAAVALEDVTGPSSVPGAAVTFDPSTVNQGTSTFAFSNGNLTVNFVSGATDFVTVASTTSHASGKYYIELTFVDSAPGGEDDGAGTIVGSVPSGGLGSGASPTTLGFYDDGTAFVNALVVGSGTPFVTADVVGLAIDVTNMKIWQRVNSGNWNASPAASPSGNVGGLAIPGAGPVLFGASIGAPGDAVTMNAAGPFAHPAPSGFAPW